MNKIFINATSPETISKKNDLLFKNICYQFFSYQLCYLRMLIIFSWEWWMMMNDEYIKINICINIFFNMIIIASLRYFCLCWGVRTIFIDYWSKSSGHWSILFLCINTYQFFYLYSFFGCYDLWMTWFQLSFFYTSPFSLVSQAYKMRGSSESSVV